MDTTKIPFKYHYDTLDLKLINFALIKCEYIINENKLLKKKLLFQDSIINDFSNKQPKVIIQDKIIFKHNWAITALFTSIVLIINYSLFIYLNN